MKLTTFARLAALALSLAALPALAHEGIAHGGCAADQTFTAGDIHVSGAFSRATLPGAPVGAGYMTVHNTGTTADRLLAVNSEIAPTIELHDMKVENGMMKMEQFENGIEVPAGGTVTLAPGGRHVMFINPVQALKEGECVVATLTFEQAGALEVNFVIGPVGAKEAPGHEGH